MSKQYHIRWRKCQKYVYVTHKRPKLHHLRAPVFTPSFWWSPCCWSFYFFVLSCYVSLRSEFNVVISVWKQCSLRLYTQLFVGGRMSYLRYLCLFTYSGVQHMLCCVFCFVYLRLVSCVPNVPNISGLPILDCLFGDFSNVYLKCMD